VGWPEVVETAARGIAIAVKEAKGNCVSISPSGLFEVLDRPFHPTLASQFKHILTQLEGMGVVSHRRYRRYGRKAKVFYVICRDVNPMTDGHFNPVTARLLWDLVKALPTEDAVKAIKLLILTHDGQSPVPKPPILITLPSQPNRASRTTGGVLEL
jgi:hypothetical protein